MQTVFAGAWLSATTQLHDTYFQDAEVFIYEYNQDGAVGFVVNRFFGRCLNELEEFAKSKPIALQDGGPVDREHLFVLHRRPELITGSTHITDNIFFGGNFDQAIRLLNNGQLPETDICIFIGYCGWDHGQLEEEIEEGSWQISNIDSAKLFHSL